MEKGKLKVLNPDRVSWGEGGFIDMLIYIGKFVCGGLEVVWVVSMDQFRH